MISKRTGSVEGHAANVKRRTGIRFSLLREVIRLPSITAVQSRSAMTVMALLSVIKDSQHPNSRNQARPCATFSPITFAKALMGCGHQTAERSPRTSPSRLRANIGRCVTLHETRRSDQRTRLVTQGRESLTFSKCRGWNITARRSRPYRSRRASPAPFSTTK